MYFNIILKKKITINKEIKKRHKMGIRNMNKLIRHIAPNCIREFYLNELKGKRLAIDALIFIYEVKKKMKITRETFHHVFQQKLLPLMEHTDKLIFVFDGKKIKEKSFTVMKRRIEKQKLKIKMKNTEDSQLCSNLDRQLVEVHSSDIYETKDIIKQKGLSMVQSFDEGEATCVKLIHKGHADYILTSDTDCLAFGHSYIHRKCRKSDEFNSTTPYLFTDLPKLIKQLGFISQEQFVDMSVLLGCDFSDPLKKLIYHKIPNVIRQHGSLETYLKHAVNSKIAHFTTERNSPKTLLRSKNLFLYILGEFDLSLPWDHRKHHLAFLIHETSNNTIPTTKQPPQQSSMKYINVSNSTSSSLFFSKPVVNGGEHRGIFQETLEY